MQQIIYFFQKFKFFLFFLFLQIIAIIITFNNLNFHKSKYINSANFFTGSIYSSFKNLSTYFSLNEQNMLLVEENNRLKNLLEKQKTTLINKDSTILDTLKYNQKFTYTNAKISKNEYLKPFNFLLINKGYSQGIDKEMAVINSKGVIGVTENSSSGYTRVQSILNRNSNINARLKNSFYYGTLTWDGKHYNTVQLIDIQRQAPLKIGDTIETGGKSTIFPEGIPIGKVKKINKDNIIDNKIDITLFNDMSNLGYVYVIKSLEKLEIESLQSKNNE